MNVKEAEKFTHLIRAQRWAALATAGDGAPLASMVAYVPLEDLSGFLFHLSALARHTGNLLQTGRGSLAITEADNGKGDPQTLARVSISGLVREIPRDQAVYPVFRRLYLACLPTAEPLFGFGDFKLFLLEPVEVNCVAGFAKAYTLDKDGFVALVGKSDKVA